MFAEERSASPARRHTASRRSVLLSSAVCAAVLLGACASDDDTTTGSVPAPDAAESTIGIDVDTSLDTSVDTSDEVDSSDESVAGVDDDVATRTSEAVGDAAGRLDMAAAEALNDGDFTLMLEALSMSGLADDLDDGDVTILAPSDSAFRALSTDAVGELFASPSSIDDILQRHVLTEAYSFEELKSRSAVETLSGETLTVMADGDALVIDGARVTEIEDLDEDSSSVDEFRVYAIDQVLLDR
jgi:uncharacterized surface protein with fasciclin (FAS1) repeats